MLTARTVNDLTVTRWRLAEDQRAAYELMARIPPAASVSANDRLVAHLATRREVYVFPNGIGDSEYIIERRLTRTAIPPDGYAPLAVQDTWVLWRRRS